MAGFDGGRIFSRRWRWVRVIVLWGGFRFGVLLYVLLSFYFASVLLLTCVQYGGQEGVELGIKILHQELKITMALAGYVHSLTF